MDIRNFTLEGKQLMVVGRLAEDGVPVYDLFKLNETESLSFSELRDALQEIREDITDMIYEYSGEPKQATIAEFERLWGESRATITQEAETEHGKHDQAQESDGGRADAQ